MSDHHDLAWADAGPYPACEHEYDPNGCAGCAHDEALRAEARSKLRDELRAAVEKLREDIFWERSPNRIRERVDEFYAVLHLISEAPEEGS